LVNEVPVLATVVPVAAMTPPTVSPVAPKAVVVVVVVPVKPLPVDEPPPLLAVVVPAAVPAPVPAPVPVAAAVFDPVPLLADCPVDGEFAELPQAPSASGRMHASAMLLE
jgi:hypothetical protein